MLPSKWFWASICGIVSLVAGGTYSFLTNVMVATPCPSCSDADSSFKKPWFATFMIFFGQLVTNSLLLGGISGFKHYHSEKTKKAQSDIASSPVSPTGVAATVSVDGTDATYRDGPRNNGRVNRRMPHESTSPVSPAEDTALAPSMLSPLPMTSIQPQSADGSLSPWRMPGPMLIIALLDVATVFLQSIASLYIPAAINSALRGTLLLVTAFANRCMGVDDGKAGRQEWIGIIVSSCGACIVGAVHIIAAAVSPQGLDASAESAVIGVAFSLFSNITLAFGIAYETKIFEKRKPSPVVVNVIRNTVGSVVLVFALMIASSIDSDRDHGRFENGSHTFCCISSEPKLAGFAAGLALGASFSGITALYLSVLVGSNFRALIYVGRAVFIWFLQLATYYVMAAVDDPFADIYGRMWTYFSYPQLFGFLVLVLGGFLTVRGKMNREKQIHPTSETVSASPTNIEMRALVQTEGGTFENAPLASDPEVVSREDPESALQASKVS